MVTVSILHRKIGLLFLVVWLILLTQVSYASKYLPNNLGDVYTFQVTENGSATSDRTVKVADQSSSWRFWNDFGGIGPLWIWTYDDNELIYIYFNQITQPLTNFSFAPGSRVSLSGSNCSSSAPISAATIVAKNLQLTVPAGDFDNVILLELEGLNTCSTQTSISIWFALDVGIVKYEKSEGANITAYELEYAVVDGVIYESDSGGGGGGGSEEGINVNGKINRLQFSTDEDIELDISLTVVNNESTPLPITYQDCSLTITIFDASLFAGFPVVGPIVPTDCGNDISIALQQGDNVEITSGILNIERQLDVGKYQVVSTVNASEDLYSVTHIIEVVAP